MGEVRWGFDVHRTCFTNVWTFGVTLDHMDDETTLCLSVGRTTLTIGRFWQEEIKEE